MIARLHTRKRRVAGTSRIVEVNGMLDSKLVWAGARAGTAVWYVLT
jgi:hypothetical protein